MSPKRYIPVLLACAFLTSCLGTDAKQLSKKSTSTATSTNTDIESFSITNAYRKDTDPDDGRVVALQGVRNIASASLATNCGTSGATCQCLFYTSTSDTSPVSGTISANGLSAANNSFTCTIPGAVDPDNYTKVRLKTTDGTKSTGFINISTTLTLTDVIGDLAQAKVRGIYRYSCTRTFFEGEGVSATGVECPALPGGQKLGLITAAYNYYLYNSQSGGNLAKKGSNVAWDSAICEKQFPRLTCDSTPEVRWGLYAEQTGIFQVGITMVANGVDSDASQIYGYAALTDSAGNCPTGLIKISQWEAQPASIIQGSINGSNPPSSFVNQSNNLNNKIVEDANPATPHSPFLVFRASNAVPCAPTGSTDPVPGSCRNVAFNGASQVQSVAYTKLTPVVCAIPKNLINGLF
jgi:hypothetical protein